MSRTRKVPVYEATTVDGITEQTFAGYEQVAEPEPPRDVRAVVKVVMFRLLVGFTVLAMVMSAAAIGQLFARVITPWIAYPGAALFDALWVYALMGEYLSQTRPKARRAAQASGIAFMAASMAAIVLEAYSLHQVLVGVPLALVPAAVKGAWMLRFETTQHRLPVAYQNRLEAERNKVYTALAVEEDQRELDRARALTRELSLSRSTEPDDKYKLLRVDGADVEEVSAKVTELVSSSAQQLKAQRLAQLTELVSRSSEPVSPAQVMSELDVSLATAKRYLKEARS
jgi:hypothetical protein